MPQSSVTIVDTFSAFEAYWVAARSMPMCEQIEAWAASYMNQWPELLDKQTGCYARDGLDWRQVAAERVFPQLACRLEAMRRARRVLRREIRPVWDRAAQCLPLDLRTTAVIYVGIGCGAGWAASYGGHPAVLFGLENVAECGWTTRDAIRGLFAHELGHLAHGAWRADRALRSGDGPWWQLYSEGFAQRLEHVILGRETWHESVGLNGPDWLTWCERNKPRLATAFLKYQDSPDELRNLFGSWFDFHGRKQCGYFLGHALICELEKTRTLREIATLERPRDVLEPMVRSLAAGQA